MKKRESFHLIYDSNCKELKTIDQLCMKKRKISCLSSTLQYGVLSKNSFDRFDAFHTFIAKCSSGQKRILIQSSSQLIACAFYTC